jgi:TetR/AcrR family transcriptional regulator, regulator of autoinduction and epiphytic fitness
VERAGAPAPEGARRGRVLDAALTVFLRYGFRKTSMEEVARAAQLSRQALYLHFATKEELFAAAVQHFLETGLEAATQPLRDASLTLEAQLLAALDAWLGRFVGLGGGDVEDLHAASQALVGPLIVEYEEQFLERMARALRGSGLPAAYKSASISARQLAETLQATGRGLKHGCASRAEFGERMGVAVRALCFPLRQA